MIVLIGSTKGGAGKTTLATNIAVALSMVRREQGRDVLLIDGDKQESTHEFCQDRAETRNGDLGFTFMQLHGQLIRDQMTSLNEKYADIIIDCGGTDNPSLRAAMLVAERMVIPVMPREIDIKSLRHTISLISEVRLYNPALRPSIVINAGDPTGQDNEATKEEIKARYLTAPDGSSDWVDPGVDILDGVIVRRKALSDAWAFGLSVLEYRPRNSDAIAELIKLMAEIYGTDIQDIYDGDTTQRARVYA